MKKNFKKIVSLVAVIAIIAAVGLGAYSYFTDYAKSNKLEGKAGDLSISLTDVTTDLTNGLTIMNPGDSNPLTFTVNNTGEKSTDVKAVITVTSSKEMTDAHEYKIMNGTTELTGGLMSSDKKSIVYTIADAALIGSVEKDASLDGTDASKVYTYNFAMDKSCDNAWQDTTFSVEIEIFAKQHRNTQADHPVNSDWISIVKADASNGVN